MAQPRDEEMDEGLDFHLDSDSDDEQLAEEQVRRGAAGGKPGGAGVLRLKMHDLLPFTVTPPHSAPHMHVQARRRAAVVRDRIPLHHFLRLIAPNRLVEHGQAASNDDLVLHLKRAGALTRWARRQRWEAGL